MRPRLYAIRPISGHLIHLITAEMLTRFFDNRDPRDWTDPAPICAVEWVSKKKETGGLQNHPHSPPRRNKKSMPKTSAILKKNAPCPSERRTVLLPLKGKTSETTSFDPSTLHPAHGWIVRG